MAKKSKKILALVIALALCVAMLVGCAKTEFKPVPGGDATADTISNNGMVVKQGDYYYFINGLGSYDKLTDIKENTFGTPLKGAICRVKKDAAGAFTDFQIIVPKVVLDKSKEQGFSIFGEHIYYISPSITTDTKGVVQVGYTDFFRCKIDGSATTKIATVKGDALQYKFTDKGLVYLDEKVLKTVPYNATSVAKEKTIAEDVVSTSFSISNNYKVGVETAQDYVFYTKAIDEENVNANEVFATNGDGSSVVKLMGKTSYTDNAEDKNNQYQITLKMAKVEKSGDVVIYYEKGGSYKIDGLFGYNLGANAIPADFKFDKTKEKQFSNIASLTAVPLSFADGAMLLDATNSLLYMPTIVGGLEVSRIEWKYTKGATLTPIEIIKEDANNMYMIHASTAGTLEKLKMNPNGGFEGNSLPIITKGVNTDWVKYEIIDGDLFYFNSTYMNYTFTAKLSALDPQSETGITATFVGKMTDTDKEAYDKQLKDEAEAKENK